VRVRGYDRVESALPPVRQSGGLPESYAFRERVRDALRRAGLHHGRDSLSISRAIKKRWI